MSRSYKQTLELVGNEYESARFSLIYVMANWQKQNIHSDKTIVSPENLKLAANHLEVTYIIRLFATFEGLLKQYISEYHPTISLPVREEKMKVGWYIDRVAQFQSPHISNQLRMRVFDIRSSRNDLIHSGRATGLTMTFKEAINTLAKYLSFLPDPSR